jgi:tetratricopeptide (TPR) repeat protein
MGRVVGYVIGALVGVGVVLVGSISAARSSDGPPAGWSQIPTEARIRDLDIEFYKRRVERDSQSAGDYTQLAGLYLQRARGTADNQDLVRAEQNARHSLQLRTGRNVAAFGVLASSLLAQHRFAEALEVAHRVLAADSTSIAARALLAETQFEMGHYEDAGRTLGSLATYRENPSVAPRLARWEELHGRPEQARRLLRIGRDAASRLHGMPKEQLAWFHLRLGDLALRYGRLGEAARELRSGLRIAPADYRLLGTLARVEAGRRRWDRAIQVGERAIATALDPTTLGLLSDAYAAKGDHARSAEYARVLKVAISQQPGPFHRAWSVFLLDHDREVQAVLLKTREELKERRDIYGYDLLAWALHKSGRQVEAREAMSRALGLGTRDAMLFYHAGVIERALGNDAAARKYLEAALEANPYWHPFQPAAARATLDSIPPLSQELDPVIASWPKGPRGDPAAPLLPATGLLRAQGPRNDLNRREWRCPNWWGSSLWGFTISPTRRPWTTCSSSSRLRRSTEEGIGRTCSG